MFFKRVPKSQKFVPSNTEGLQSILKGDFL
jgi:hypothetical protein